MNFKQKISETLGNKVLDIETINRKDALPASVQEIRARRERAEVLVRKKALLSSGATVVPIPGFDFGMDMKLMRDVIEDVNKIYGLDHQQVNQMSDDMKNRILMAARVFKAVS